MERIRLGAIDSREELESLAVAIERSPGSRDRFAYFLASLRRLQQFGFVRERAKWIDTGRPGLKIYTGFRSEPRRGEIRIWAAVEIRQGQLAALVKSSDRYAGNRQDFADRLAEAEDRFVRGIRSPW